MSPESILNALIAYEHLYVAANYVVAAMSFSAPNPISPSSAFPPPPPQTGFNCVFRPVCGNPDFAQVTSVCVPMYISPPSAFNNGTQCALKSSASHLQICLVQDSPQCPQTAPNVVIGLFAPLMGYKLVDNFSYSAFVSIAAAPIVFRRVKLFDSATSFRLALNQVMAIILRNILGSCFSCFSSVDGIKSVSCMCTIYGMLRAGILRKL